MRTLTWRVTVVVSLALASLLVLATPNAGAANIDQRDATSVPFGQVVVSGTSWLNGSGVDVRSNFGHTYDGPSQCVELVKRLYRTRGWITGGWTGNGSDLYSTAPANLTKEPQGSISHVFAGDVLVFNTNFFPVYGHAAVVDTVNGSAINTLSQNMFPASLRWAQLTLSGPNILVSGSASMVVGVIHSPVHPFARPPTGAAPPPPVPNLPPPVGAAFMTYPTNGQMGVAITRPFAWSTIAQAEGYILVVGTSRFGTNLVNSGILPPTRSSYATPPLPAGQVLYATLLTKVNGVFDRFQDVTFIS